MTPQVPPVSRRVSVGWWIAAAMFAALVLIAVGFGVGVFRIQLFKPTLL